MYEERFELLLEVLREVREEGTYFDMSDWRYCALGHLARTDHAQELGFHYSDSRKSVVYKRKRAYEAAQKFFEIPEYTAAIKLFNPSFYTDTRDTNEVISRLEDFVEEIPWK